MMAVIYSAAKRRNLMEMNTTNIFEAKATIDLLYLCDTHVEELFSMHDEGAEASINGEWRMENGEWKMRTFSFFFFLF